MPNRLNDFSTARFSRLFPVALLALALAGVALVLVDTRWGAYLSDDTYYYIAPARDLLVGKGFTPSYIFAPLFPLALAGISLLGMDALVAARWLNALLFGVNIWLVGWIARRMNLSPGFSLVAAGLVLLADGVVEAHGWAMSEALAFTCLLLSLFFTLGYLSTGRQRDWWGAAAASALAVLTRYAALPLAGAIGLAMLVLGPGRSLWRKAKSALLFGLVSLAPVALYWARNALVSGHPVRYQSFSFAPLTHDQVVWFLYNWLSLFIPGRFLRGREVAAGWVLLVGGLVLLGWWLWKRRGRQAGAAEPAWKAGMLLLGAVIGLNLLMLYLARGLSELDVLNPRYLVPLLILALVMLAACGDRVWRGGGKPARAAVAAFFVLFLAYYGYRTADFSRGVYQTGLGYSNVGWHSSETVAFLDAHPELTRLVSTGEMGIYFWTGRMPLSLAAYPDPAALKNYLCQNGAVLLIMDQLPAEMYGASYEDVARALQLARTFNDSQMFVCPDGP